MKVRIGFVSNSSSASFVIQKDMITEEQAIKIKNHIAEGRKLNELKDPDDDYNRYYVDDYDAWQITEDEKTLEGYTSMDNFGMEAFLEEIGIDKKAIKFEGDN